MTLQGQAPRHLRGFNPGYWVTDDDAARCANGDLDACIAALGSAWERYRAAQNAWADEHGCHPMYPRGRGPTAFYKP